MTMNADIPLLQRVTFFDGELLTAADLTDVQELNRQLRWLHNRSLHTWGIGLGLGVTGQKGDRAVTIAPGYAVDCLGRELVLLTAQTQPIPPVAAAADGSPASYYLVARYAGDDDLAPDAETRQGLCGTSGAVRLPEEPIFAWRAPSAVMRGYEIVLAQIWVLNCQLNDAASAAPRRDARPSQQPFIAAGASDPIWTAWSFWPDGTDPSSAAGVQTTIDTSGARFQTTPQYVARLAGTRVVTAPGPAQGQLAGGFAGVSNQTASSFTFQLLMPRNIVAGKQLTLNPDAIFTAALPGLLQTLQWSVVWVGTES
jgi:hypothetical protein